MAIKLFEGMSADEVWKLARQDVANWESQPSRNGLTRESLRSMFHIANPRRRWVVSRNPSMSPALAIAEVAWILAGDNHLSFLLPWNRDHAKFVGELPELYGAYGHRLRHGTGVDQIVRAAAALRSSPANRQTVLQIYDPRSDLPLDDGSPRAQDIPCNVTSLLKVRHGRLEWTQILRSNDLHLGVPYNFVQFTMLQEVIAGLVGVEVGAYAHYSDSLHVYEAHATLGLSGLEEAEPDEDLRVEASNFEKLVEAFYRCIGSLGNAKDDVAIWTAIDEALPRPWKGLAYICASERARRIGRESVAEELLSLSRSESAKRIQRAYAASKK